MGSRSTPHLPHATSPSSLAVPLHQETLGSHRSPIQYGFSPGQVLMASPEELTAPGKPDGEAIRIRLSFRHQALRQVASHAMLRHTGQGRPGEISPGRPRRLP